MSEFILKTMGSQILVFSVTASFELYPGVQRVPWYVNLYIVYWPVLYVYDNGVIVCWGPWRGLKFSVS